jgi:hypothetical protein
MVRSASNANVAGSASPPVRQPQALAVGPVRVAGGKIVGDRSVNFNTTSASAKCPLLLRTRALTGSVPAVWLETEWGSSAA